MTEEDPAALAPRSDPDDVETDVLEIILTKPVDFEDHEYSRVELVPLTAAHLLGCVTGRQLTIAEQASIAGHRIRAPFTESATGSGRFLRALTLEDLHQFNALGLAALLTFNQGTESMLPTLEKASSRAAITVPLTKPVRLRPVPKLKDGESAPPLDHELTIPPLRGAHIWDLPHGELTIGDFAGIAARAAALAPIVISRLSAFDLGKVVAVVQYFFRSSRRTGGAL